MKRKYHDMYELFRHDRNAEEYFDELPSYVQDRIRGRYQCVDSMDALIHFAQYSTRGPG